MMDLKSFLWKIVAYKGVTIGEETVIDWQVEINQEYQGLKPTLC